jgi:hypothetical protein
MKIHIYIYICLYVYTQIHVYIYIYIHICKHIFIYLYVYIYRNIYTFINMNICIYIYVLRTYSSDVFVFVPFRTEQSVLLSVVQKSCMIKTSWKILKTSNILRTRANSSVGSFVLAIEDRANRSIFMINYLRITHYWTLYNTHVAFFTSGSAISAAWFEFCYHFTLKIILPLTVLIPIN